MTTALTEKSETTTTESYEAVFSETMKQVNQALEIYLANDSLRTSNAKEAEEIEGPNILWEAIRYSTLDGGKRIRPILAIETCLALGGNLEAVLPTACAVELVHAQSLVHDDLPCMDNDDLRRGRPTVHKAFDEATAVLVGDALLSFAFGIITKHTPLGETVHPERLLKVVGDFSDVASVKGLVNGQFVDIFYEQKAYDAQVLEYIHTFKTGALFQFSARAGAILSGADDTTIEAMTTFGQKLGLAFQIVDDLLDIQSTSEALGKTAGKDQVQEKATYPGYYGEQQARQKAQTLIEESTRVLDTLPIKNKAKLIALAEFIQTRVS